MKNGGISAYLTLRCKRILDPVALSSCCRSKIEAPPARRQPMKITSNRHEFRVNSIIGGGCHGWGGVL